VIGLSPNGVKIMVATQPVDFRRGMNGLVALVASALSADPYCGDVFVFRAKRCDRLRCIYWDGSGMILATNDLHSYCISLSGSVEGFGVSGIFLMGGDAIDELVPSTALLLR
jgi:transposase